MAQKYRSKTAQMLNQCADQLVDMELTIDVDDEELEAFRKRKLAAKTRINSWWLTASLAWVKPMNEMKSR